MKSSPSLSTHSIYKSSSLTPSYKYYYTSLSKLERTDQDESLSLAVTLLASFCAYVAADTENYQVFAAAAQASGVSIKGNRRYSMYEYWHSTGGFVDCISGFSHVRVVYGKVVTRNGEKDFIGTAFDMVIAPGNQVEMEVEEWQANHYVRNQQWVRVSQDSQYYGVHKVKSGLSDNGVREIGTLSQASFIYNPVSNIP